MPSCRDMFPWPACDSASGGPIQPLSDLREHRAGLPSLMGPALTVARSRQRHDRQGPGRVRYVDLGLSAGFEADMVVDEEGLVLRYEHLFERLPLPA
jgi:hypothetical protein